MHALSLCRLMKSFSIHPLIEKAWDRTNGRHTHRHSPVAPVLGRVKVVGNGTAHIFFIFASVYSALRQLLGDRCLLYYTVVVGTFRNKAIAVDQIEMKTQKQYYKRFLKQTLNSQFPISTFSLKSKWIIQCIFYLHKN